MTAATFGRVFVAVVGLGAISACEKSPVEPFDNLKGLSVSGPTSAAPGQTVRYTATGYYTDGTTRDVTGEATWRASPQVSFTSAGVATAQGIGETDVTATLHVFKAQVRILVLEPGTFKLSGRITERGGGTTTAKVYVLSGVGQDKQSIASDYRIYGVAGPIRLEVSKTGFFTIVHDINVSGHLVQDFELVHLEPPVDVAGNWTLTLGPPPPGCPDGLPAFAQMRSYRLAVSQRATRLDLQVLDPTVTVVENLYTAGDVSGQRVTLFFQNPVNDFDVETGINLLDRLSPTETFSFTGVMGFQGNASPIVTTMIGTFRYWARPVTQPPTWECRASNYPVTLQR